MKLWKRYVSTIATTQLLLLLASPSANALEVMGAGFDLERDLVRASCINGVVSNPPGRSSSDIKLGTKMSQSELSNELKISVDGKSSSGLFKVNASSDFVRHSTSNAYSETFVYSSKFTTPDSVFAFDTNPLNVLNLTGANALAGGIDTFREICGNRYIAKHNIGGGLYFSVKLNFEKSTDKTKFNAEIGGSYGASDLNIKVSETINRLNIKGSIDIRAIQIGGKVTSLSSIIAPGSAKIAPVVSCSFKNLTSCKTLITALIKYASIDFPAQLNAPANNNNVIGSVYGDYNLIGVVIPPASNINVKVVLQRKNIANEIITLTEYSDRAMSLLFVPSVQSDSALSKSIRNFNTNVLANIDLLKTTGLRCWNYPAECLVAVKVLNSNLANIDPSVLVNSRKIKSQFDASGKIEIAVFERIAGLPQQRFIDFKIEVPSDYVVIGGGGEAAHSPVGNLLTASYPNRLLTAWIVSSKDHNVAQAIKLKGYAIGMKIAGLSRDQLKSLISVSTNSSTWIAHPNITQAVTAGHLMIGGGMKVNWTGNGNLATASYPINSNTWAAKSKDHSVSSPATIDIFTIGIPSFIAGVGNLSVITTEAISQIASHPVSQVQVANGYALVGCGAFVDWTGAGNLLWRLKPISSGTQFGCMGGSKDHSVGSPAPITTFALGLKVY